VFVKAGDEQALATILDPRFDPARVAIVDTSSRLETQQINALPQALSVSVKVTRYEPGSIALELASPAPQKAALIVSENFFPGWSATVDGNAAALDRAEFNLIGVSLPAGARKIQLRFDDAAYEAGKVVTLIAVTLALLLAAAGAVRERRSRRAVLEVRHG
jgi:hypothetical protein